MNDKIFSNENINTGRQSELDWARGLAVLFMVLVHVKLELPGFPFSDTYSKIIEFCGSPLAAPVFMTLMGAGIIYSRNSNPKKLFTRGLILLIMHYALNFIAFGLPDLIMFAQTGDATFVKDFMTDVFGVDILAFAGLTFLFFALIKKWQLEHIHIILITLAVSCANYLLTIPTDNLWAGAVFGLFVHVNEYSYFPFLSWIGYPVMGYIFGGFLIRCTNKKVFYRYLFAFSVLIITAISLGACKYNFDIWSMHFGPDDYYFQDFIQYFLVGGICFAWISALYALPAIKSHCFIGKTVFWCSKNVTTIYFIHWIIIGWISRLQLIDFPVDWRVNFTTGIVVFILANATAYLYLRLKETIFSSRKH